ncbi:DUF4183 domain-containing protein [Paenibacillus polymyxa]|jgi:hypothetical protein|uniref:DUF4183 domain-containing protein n=1 Tax=Paenibacillus polymyxa TaxID=1406 RepID=A0A378Y3X8_PAEPO|nr:MULTISPECIES: DUF4183 domain-containing protein [Paenibacillus]KAE8558198.1 hypothetical protein BJH92_21355 [Paenibacillus polymyxa]KAF6586092.1 DUF4183 domain-containing protein [Paenibacillus sp. EKM211P]KAF6659499.1 DUF4183 domain-containing protein [Paenibacillus sp. EKM301P]KJD38646.1 hypothetical protein QD46_18495 [Paenibacillus polymyxa]KJK31194.1 hypothetical protein TY89_07270 [Paenibacillus polymyxa]
MPIIKPVFTAVATAPVSTGGAITTTITPATTRFFATITAGMIGATETTVPAASFVDDADAPVVALPALTATDSSNYYINGVIQQSSLFTLSTASLVIASVDITPGVPVVIEIADFSGTTSTITTQPTISAPTVTIIT